MTFSQQQTFTNVNKPRGSRSSLREKGKTSAVRKDLPQRIKTKRKKRGPGEKKKPGTTPM